MEGLYPGGCNDVFIPDNFFNIFIYLLLLKI